MAYQLKTVRYQDSDRKILLQNENGPCPLLAAANALLLRGVISLPPTCIRNGVASLDDVVNLLAERAMASTAGQDEHHHHHLDELLTIFPNLQYGMDVNPKFTCGPTGVEYTTNLTAFDMLNVELVHGWLLDPQDETTHSVVGNKTYNELIEFVVHGNEASTQVDNVSQQIHEKEEELNKVAARPDGDEEEWVSVDSNGPMGANAIDQQDQSTATKEEATENDKAAKPSAYAEPQLLAEGSKQTEATVKTTHTAEKDDARAEPTPALSKEEYKAKLEQELHELHDKHKELSTLATNASLVNSFLQSTSHQLTHYGLHQLYEHLADESLSVFFRNNHFATITKKNGVLYLLVTDLGYANVPDVMWEKLDGIDGDTEYVSPLFVKPAPQKELLPTGGTTLAPEQILAQRGQSDADYQLALELSRHSGPTSTSSARLDEAEGKLMAAATEASLRTYNNLPEEQTNQPKADEGNSVGTLVTVPPDAGTVDGCTTQEDSDKLIAMQLQAQQNEEDASLALARKLHNEELAAARARNGNNGGRPASRTNYGSSTSSNCVIS